MPESHAIIDLNTKIINVYKDRYYLHQVLIQLEVTKLDETAHFHVDFYMLIPITARSTFRFTV